MGETVTALLVVLVAVFVIFLIGATRHKKRIEEALPALQRLGDLEAQSQRVQVQAEQALSALPRLDQELGGLKETVAKLPGQELITALQGEIETLRANLRDVDKKLPETIASDLTSLGERLATLGTALEERKTLDEQAQAAIRRVEAVIAGASSRGAAGESILAEAFAQFPAEMLDTQFKVNGHPVEFALILPNKKRLAIDAKWPAKDVLERLGQAVDAAEQQELLRQVERAVAKKVEEVTKYIDPARTVNLAIAAVPDAAYAACRTAHVEAYRQRVLLMPYSLTIPYMLTLYHLHLQYARSIDVENLENYLSQLEVSLDFIDKKLDDSVQRAATMVDNAYQEIKQRIGQMRGALAYLKAQPREAPSAAAEI